MKIKSVHTITIIKDEKGVIHLDIPTIPIQSEDTYYELAGALEMVKKELIERSYQRAKRKNDEQTN